MDSFIGTVVFILPGFLVYFWIQSFGINPVVKHSPIELTAISGMLWLPVSLITIWIYNILQNKFPWFYISGGIYDLLQLKESSVNIKFLTIFLVLSVLISYIFSIAWSLLGYPLQRMSINLVRTMRKTAKLSKTSSVWDEVFLGGDPQVVGIQKLDKPEDTTIIGCIEKASRTFEPERNLVLNDVEFFTNLVKEYEVPVESVFIDTKSGTLIKVYHPKAIERAQKS